MSASAPKKRSIVEQVSLALMSLVYIASGIAHFAISQFYLRIMPPWIPFHEAAVYVSGVIELALGVLLWPPRTRRWAAIGIIALLVAVFPANIYMAQHPELFGAPWMLYARLPFQLVFIAWAYWHARRAGRA